MAGRAPLQISELSKRTVTDERLGPVVEDLRALAAGEATA
jgi:hypothetical protein